MFFHFFYFIKSQTSDSFVNHFDGHFAYLKTLDFSFKNNPALIRLNICLPHLQQNCVQARRIPESLSVSSSMRPGLHGNLTNFHRCLVRSRSFAGTDRFLAGLFTFLSSWPIVNRLRACGRNWFRTIMTTRRRKKEKEKKSVFRVVFRDIMLCNYKMWSSRIQMNGGKLPETERERYCLKPFCHTDLDIFLYRPNKRMRLASEGVILRYERDFPVYLRSLTIALFSASAKNS